MTVRDRRAAVLGSSTFNGIDFVTIANSTQTRLQVHFINAVAVEGSLAKPPAITGGESITTIDVLPIRQGDWGWDEGHVVLTLRVAAPGDFSAYTLTLASPVLDAFFASVPFSFKAGCRSDVDCAPMPPVCPPAPGDAPPIDYLAKDFLSFRQALLDFSALRYPAWQERSEADFGMMFLEALSAIADELSYTQDRVAREASLATATERRSALRHARLVDYELAPARGAITLLQFDVSPGTDSIPRGLAVIAPGPDGTPLGFETGLGLHDDSPPAPASALWNRAAQMRAYWFDDSVKCLPVGAAQMYVLGRGYQFQPGQALLIETAADSPADPPLRQLVHLLQTGDGLGPASESCDPLFPRAVTDEGPPYLTCRPSPPCDEAPTAVTCIRWEASDALTAARDLSRTVVIGNICNATQGRTAAESFVIGPPPPGLTNMISSALERSGPRPLLSPGACGAAPAIRLYTLANAPLTWLARPEVNSGLPVPEVRLIQAQPLGAGPVSVEWNWMRWLLESKPSDTSFTIDPAAYRAIARNSDGSVQSEYDSGTGDTIRFGDGVFGANPVAGMQFTAQYRYGAGAAGNVAAGAIRQLDPATIRTGLYVSVMNPFAATGGADPESIQSAQRLAPQAFRAAQLRAVVAQDYVNAAMSLPWVKRAGAQFRWTGSWLTTFTTPEPRASEAIAIDDRTGLIDLLNRYRMAGTESYVPDPVYLSIDLQIQVCALPDAFAAGIEQATVAALSPRGPNAASAFFAVSRFGFGEPLERSELEAAIQAVPGVAGVLCIDYRLRDRSPLFSDMGDTVAVGPNQILRCDNDPSRPGNGSLSVTVQGGR
jgi:hypothetical protein